MAKTTVMVAAFCGMALAVNALPAIRMPASGWHVNNFKNRDCGTEFETLAAPDGSDAIRVKFFGDKASNLVMPPPAVIAQRDSWPETFTGLKGYWWNNGNTNAANISLRTDAGQWNAQIILDHSGWKVVEIRSVVNYQDKHAAFDPRKTASLFINSPRAGSEFAVGALYWEPEGALMQPLDIGNAALMLRAAMPPEIDGQLGDETWTSAAALPLAYYAHNLPGKPAAHNRVKVAYDRENIYIAAWMPLAPGTTLKATLKEDNVELWDEEDFEFFLYPAFEPQQYYQFIVNPLGARANIARVFDQVEDRIVLKFKHWTPVWRARTAVHAGAWTVEAAVPWSTIGAAGIPPLVQFQAMRGDHSGDAPSYPVWSPVLRRPTEGFGILAPAGAAAPALQVQALTMKRLDDNLVGLSCFLEAPLKIGAVDLEAWYTAPGCPAARVAGNFAVDTPAGPIHWVFDGGTPVSGLHQAALKVTPADTNLAVTCAIYSFNQMLPSRFKFADVVFNPEPKKLAWGEGAFELKKDHRISVPADAAPRTLKTAAYLAQRLHGLYGFRLEVEPGGAGAITLAVNADAVKARGGAAGPEAYLLDVAPAGISITGAGEAGLYYGVVTLMQAASAPKQPGMPIPAFAIVDYPTYPKRIANTYTMFHEKKDIGDGLGGFDLDKLKNWIERYVAGSKYNLLCLSWGDQVNYASLPELHHPRNFTPAEIAGLYEFAREHFLDAFPGVLFGAHAPAFTHHFPDLIEEKYGVQQMDATNPRVYEIMARVYRDLLDMAGGHPKYFQTFNDEWWHKSRTRADAVYKGQTRQNMFYKFLMAEYNLLKEREVRMIMFTDMLHPKHNGGPPFNLSAVAEKLPRDIVLATWSESNEYFDQLGFKELWRIDNGFSAHARKSWQGDTGFGRIQYGSGDLFNQTDQQRTLYYAFHTALQAANYAWNRDEKGTLPMAEWTMQFMPSLMGVYSMQPNPDAGAGLTPLNLPGAAPAVADVSIESIKAVGGIPVRPGAVTIATNAPLSMRFDPGTRISSLYTLNNIAPRDPAAVRALHELYRKKPDARPYGLIVGHYRLTYWDGTAAEMPLRLGRDIALLRHTPAESRYVRNCRAVYPLNTEQTLALNQFEWVNPRPDLDVRLLEIESVYDFAPMLVAGITCRNTKENAELASTTTEESHAPKE